MKHWLSHDRLYEFDKGSLWPGILQVIDWKLWSEICMTPVEESFWEKVALPVGFRDFKFFRNNLDLKSCLGNTNAIVNQNEADRNQVKQHRVGTWKLQSHELVWSMECIGCYALLSWPWKLITKVHQKYHTLARSRYSSCRITRQYHFLDTLDKALII